MTTDPLNRLRAANPLPHGSSAPPVDHVVALIGARDLGSRRRPGWAGVLLPMLGAAAAIAVVVVAFVVVRSHGGTASKTPPATSTTAPPPTPAAPRGGMPGVVAVFGVTAVSPQTMLISLEQCQPCHAARRGGQQKLSGWLATTSDGGLTWGVNRRPWALVNPRFSGRDGWAEGTDDSRAARFYVTHDGGRNWAVAPSAAPALGDGNVSVAADEVWAVGNRCAAVCTTAVMRGPAAGDNLPAAPVQPFTGGDTDLLAVAAGPGRAYVSNAVNPAQSYATADDGRTWRRLSAPCPPRVGFSQLAVAGPDVLWETCEMRKGGEVLRRSSDAGRHWRTLRGAPGPLFTLQPTSARVAWALTNGGHVIRTADGGRSWSTVWTVGGSQPSALAGHTPVLTTQSGASAGVVVSLTHGHVQKHAVFTNLVVYRTTDGGATWQASVVRLPEGAG